MEMYFYVLFGLLILIFITKIFYSYLDYRKDIKEFKERKKHRKK